eukprot:2525409-Pleurochrysis_carterae.AAC.3
MCHDVSAGGEGDFLVGSHMILDAQMSRAVNVRASARGVIMVEPYHSVLHGNSATQHGEPSGDWYILKIWTGVNENVRAKRDRQMHSKPMRTCWLTRAGSGWPLLALADYRRTTLNLVERLRVHNGMEQWDMGRWGGRWK